MSKNTSSGLYARIETEINNYLGAKVEISDGVKFSQYQTIKRLYKFRNQTLGDSKINEDLSYDYYYDIITSRVDTEVKNLRFDTKHVLIFSRSPAIDYAAVYVANVMLKDWMGNNGEDEKLKAAVEEYSANGNVGFKRVGDGYEKIDPLNTYPTNPLAETIDETALIERYDMSASEMKAMAAWDQDKVNKVILDLNNKSFKATDLSTDISSSSDNYEIFEFSGEVNEKEYNGVLGLEGGDPNEFFLAKVIIAGLRDNGTGAKYPLFVEKLDKKLSHYYLYAHRGSYTKRFWRKGLYEKLFDYQIRANEIGNQLARGLDWASRVIFQSTDSTVLQNIRADMDNGDVVIAKDLQQLDVRMRGLDQLIADWNRLMEDADRVANSFEVSRGESLPSGTPFRLGALLNQNAGLMHTLIRQKITLIYKRVFREWVMPKLIKDLKGEEVFTLLGDVDVLEELRKLAVDTWYFQNLVAIGPHTKEVAIALKQEKLEEMQKVDPNIENNKEIWKNVLPRLFVTITGENSDLGDQVTDLVNLLSLEQDPVRINFLLDQIYKIRGIPVPPRVEPAETSETNEAGTSAPVEQPASQVGGQETVLE